MILNPMRQAIDSLAPCLNRFRLERGQRVFLDGEELYLLGISRGRRGDVAVFAADPPPTVRQERTTTCHGAVLLSPVRRKASRLRKPDVDASLDVSRSCVEALRVVRDPPDRLVCERTGDRESFVNLIT